MRVVAWTAYGDTTVYAADTPEQLANVINLMIEAIKDWGEEVMIAKVQKYMAKYSTEMSSMETAFRTIVNLAGTDQDPLEKVILTTVQFA
jgi:hypothetical protein